MSRKSERKRLRNRSGISIVEADPTAIVGVPASNIESAVTQAKSLSIELERTRPGEVAWVYRFAVPNTHICWVGVRFSAEPESGPIVDDDRTLDIKAIIGYRNGERVSPLGVHHGAQNPGGRENSKCLPSLDLVEKWRAFYRKSLRKD